jgi:hypothetical protein
MAGQAAGETVDHKSYLVPPGIADIFFPTDFQMLERMYMKVAKALPFTGASYCTDPVCLLHFKAE